MICPLISSKCKIGKLLDAQALKNRVPRPGRLGVLDADKIKAPPRGRRSTSLGQLVGSQTRESRDSPRLNAFWRVAPSVRFNVLAMLDARVFFLAAVFNARTSAVDHGRRFDFLATKNLQVRKKKAFS